MLAGFSYTLTKKKKCVEHQVLISVFSKDHFNSQQVASVSIDSEEVLKWSVLV